MQQHLRQHVFRSLPRPATTYDRHPDFLQHRHHLWAITCLTRGDQKCHHPAVGVDRRVDFCRPPATGTAETMTCRLARVPGGAVFPGAGGMHVSASGGGIHADLPGQRPDVVGVAEQSGVDRCPHPIRLEAGEQVVDPPPGSVAFVDIPPRASGTDAEEEVLLQSWGSRKTGVE